MPTKPHMEPLPFERFSLLGGIAIVSILLAACSPDGSAVNAPAPESAPIVTPANGPSFPFLDPSLDTASRVDDLVGRMTLEEKIGQTLNDAPAIERLGVPKYDWWSEALHGVARAGLATVFPQAIGLAATWDEDLMFQIATAISDEARAKHHDFAARGQRMRYQGLTLWSPNINIFRDPRWGRGQETYGEDPWLTGRMAVQFIRGLQGDDPKYLKTIATVKHFAVHSGPEPERHAFDARTGMRDLWETYLPQFEMGIREGGAWSLMCAYNRYNGQAACAHDLLLRDILRGQWEFGGFVVSDCGAIRDFNEHHKITASEQESAALAIKAGTDLNCGEAYQSLGKAVEEGLVSEADIDVAVKRLFTARMKLGLFDPPESVRYAQIPYSVVDSPQHQALALQAAEKSIVLLKNENGTLPLRKDLASIAVIGPNADQWPMLLGNYNGLPSHPVTPLQGIREAVSAGTRVIYAQGSELAPGMPVLTTIPTRVLTTPDSGPGLRADFFDNSELRGAVLYSETQPFIEVNWTNGAPREDMDEDNFGVRWTGTLVPEVSGRYQIGIVSTCNSDVLLDGESIARSATSWRDEYGDPRTGKSDWIELVAGQKYALEVTARETWADAQVQLVWAGPRPRLAEEALEAARNADAVVMFMGLTAQMEGEEMNIELEGFHGGDRTSLGLPANQLELIRELHALGKPVVLVLLNGSALAVDWEKENIPAIVEAWYPGQAGGTAIARVLFGDYNPAGKLPVTFYRSVDDLPPFEDYNMTTQTYRYFRGEPLYPFGHGLSYTTFALSDMQISPPAGAGEPVTVAATVRNSGALPGEEVLQVYVSRKDSDTPVPIRSLAAFDRIALAPGEDRRVSFQLPADAFALVTEEGAKVMLPGRFEISVGGGQPEQSVVTSSNVLTAGFELQ